jgi:hypothetical protein
MTLERKDTKLWPIFWVHHNVSTTLKGRANKTPPLQLLLTHKLQHTCRNE